MMFKPLWLSPTGGPTLGPVPGSEFGNPRKDRFHQGIDLNCRRIPLIPGRSGVVVGAGLSTGRGGNFVRIDHGRIRGHHFVAFHCHFGWKNQPWQDCIFVRNGQKVGPRTELGIAGDSGNALAVHDHFELYMDGKAVDPLCFIREYQQVWRPARLLRVGLFYPRAESPDVLVAQKRLNAHGYRLSEDGIYGPKMQGAMGTFQTEHGLKSDMIVGRKTWLALL